MQAQTPSTETLGIPGVPANRSPISVSSANTRALILGSVLPVRDNPPGPNLNCLSGHAMRSFPCTPSKTFTCSNIGIFFMFYQKKTIFGSKFPHPSRAVPNPPRMTLLGLQTDHRPSLSRSHGATEEPSAQRALLWARPLLFSLCGPDLILLLRDFSRDTIVHTQARLVTATAHSSEPGPSFFVAITPLDAVWI